MLTGGGSYVCRNQFYRNWHNYQNVSCSQTHYTDGNGQTDWYQSDAFKQYRKRARED